MGSMRLTVGRGDESWQDGVDPSRLAELLKDQQNLLWLDILDPGPAEIDILRNRLGFHEIALEDVAMMELHRRPRCERYSGYYFLVLYAAEHDAHNYAPRELQIFWGPRYLVTIHRGLLPIVEKARGRWLRHDGRQEHGIAYLAYALCDNLVQSYFPLQDWFEERVEDTEEAVLAGTNGATTDLFKLRKDLLRTRRLLSPTANVIAEVIRREPSHMPATLEPYLADMQAHLLHVLGELDSYLELLSAAQDVHSESMFARLALIVQRLTAITVILMAPTLIAEIYGMNLGGMIPSTDSESGFLGSTHETGKITR